MGNIITSVSESGPECITVDLFQQPSNTEKVQVILRYIFLDGRISQYENPPSLMGDRLSPMFPLDINTINTVKKFLHNEFIAYGLHGKIQARKTPYGLSISISVSD